MQYYFVGINDVHPEIFSVFPQSGAKSSDGFRNTYATYCYLRHCMKMLYETDAENRTNITIPIAQFENGMYLLQIHSEGKRSTKQFVIRK